MLETVNNCCFVYNPPHDRVLREYYLYCITLFKTVCANSKIKANFLFGDYQFPTVNNNRNIRVDIQHEHTLVKPGGRGSEGHPLGKISFQGSSYLVRIDRLDYFNSVDIIIDYSQPNAFNVQSSGLFDQYSKKSIYIAPLIFDVQKPTFKNKLYNCATTFINTQEPRRKKLLEEIINKNFNSINISNRFSKKELLSLYNDFKILINIHQTDHHDTFEELRVLSALLNGMLVVSENSPLKDLIPYNNFVIWANYTNIVDTAKLISDNYERYWHNTFTSAFSVKMNEIDKNNLLTITNKLKEFE